MKVLAPICFLLLAASAPHAQTNAVPAQRSIDIDGYAARVNDRVIMRSDVIKAAAPLLQELARNYQGAEFEQEAEKIFVRVRNELVDRALIIEAFKARETPIPVQYVDDDIRRTINSRFAGDEAAFEQVLAAEKQTRAEYKEMVRENIAVDIMMSENVLRRARITPEQVRQAYEADKEDYLIPEKVKYSVIVLNRGTTPEDRAVKQNEAELIRRRLMDGADFGETARAVSEGSRASEGGAFPWMQPKDARPELQAVLKTLPAGEVSDVIVTDAELYLVKVDARRQAGYKSFDEVRKTIKTALENAERERLRTRWLALLRENNYVFIYE